MRYKQIRDNNNLQKARFKGVGSYDIPPIRAEDAKTTFFVPFNYCAGYPHPEGTGVHFFLDDYQFKRVWDRPDGYLDMLRKFDCVLSPDFSAYEDYPLAVRIYNHYRKHWLAAYWQNEGITVIPSIGWGDRDSYAWCFDGEPVGSTVAVSSYGVIHGDQATRDRFMAGYGEMLRRLQPVKILFHGPIPPGCGGNIIPITDHRLEDRKRRSRMGRIREEDHHDT